MVMRASRWLGRVWAGLTRVGDEQPLGKAALAVVLLLDAFVLGAIFSGLDEHTAQLASPGEQVPPLCEEIVLDQAWSPAARLDRLAEAVSRAAPEPRARAVLHPLCARLVEGGEAVRHEPALTQALEDRHARQREVSELERQLGGLQSAWDTALLEAAARPKEPRTDLPVIREELRAKTAALEVARAEVATLEAALDGAAPVKALWERVASIGPAEREGLRAERRRLERWYPVKRLGMQLLFLVPLLLAFWAWNAASLRRGRGVQTLVSSHLMGVAAIPVLLRVGDALLDVIPRRLLRAVMEALVAMKLVALWHYLVIAAAVGAGLLLVLLVQRRLFSRERLLERRVARGQCQDCGRTLPAGARACPFCGFAQFRTCPSCGGLAHVRAPCCKDCGARAA